MEEWPSLRVQPMPGAHEKELGNATWVTVPRTGTGNLAEKAKA